MKYGRPPEIVGNFKLGVDEMMIYLYMPIWMPICPNHKSISEYVPSQLSPFEALIGVVLEDSRERGEQFDYWYITAKRQYVTPQNMGNRPDWHSDGYGTNDVNYVWMDEAPTEFALQEFTNLSSDHSFSLAQMKEQVNPKNVTCFSANDLIRLDQYNIHRVSLFPYQGMRTFFKLTGSNSIFNLKGNTHNHLMNYEWEMHERQEERNMESAA